MKDKKETFKNDIEKAEQTILAYSWLGSISALVVIGYCVASLI